MSDNSEPAENKAVALVKWLTDKAVRGVPPLSSANNLAQEYLLDRATSTMMHRADALVRWETSKNFTSGFLTGLGGILTLPVTVPSALGAAWIIQARLAGAIAVIYGHALSEDRVRTLVLLSLAGDAAKEVLKDVGIQIGRQALEQLLLKIPDVYLSRSTKSRFPTTHKSGRKGRAQSHSYCSNCRWFCWRNSRRDHVLWCGKGSY